MRFVTLFMLASLEPTGLQPRPPEGRGAGGRFSSGINSPDDHDRSEPGPLFFDVGLVELLVRLGEVEVRSG